jgi:predicted nucleic-acid-binding Zn-ribbon protein
MSGGKDCPKCGGIMTEGMLSVQNSAYAVNWRKGRFSYGEEIVAYRCKQCGYTELYSKEVGQYENWECPKCHRINSPKTKLCTKCGFEKEGKTEPKKS